MVKEVNKAFVYGVSVDGNNFTDRVQETRRLKMNFENGLNVVLISPRRMGKTSLVKHVQEVVDKSMIQTVYVDIYDCRSEYDFYNKFAEALLKQTANKMELVLENIKRFLVRLAPKVSFNPDMTSEYSFSLGITPKEYSPEEILSLPEMLAQHIGKHIVVCIDEFQQIGEWPDSIYVQKRLATSRACILLSVRQQATYDDEYLPKLTDAVLSIWRAQLSATDTDSGLDTIHPK